MFGKASLIVALGFSTILSVYSTKMNRLTVTNAENFNTSLFTSLVHEAAISGMNFGINYIWTVAADTANFEIVMPPCTTKVAIIDGGIDSILVRSIASTVVYVDEYHATHNELYPVIDTVFAWFSRNSPVSRWASYTNQDNGLEWTTGDTSWGPVHCNQNLRLHGSPVFYGKVTAKLGISPNPSGSGCDAEILDGWEIGIDAPLPTNLNLLRIRATQDNDGAPMNSICLYNTELTLDFMADGRACRTVAGIPLDTVEVSTIAPSGIIYNTADVKVSGVLRGYLTIITDGSIEIVNDMVYSKNPLTDETCEDILGLIATNSIIVTDNVPNSTDVSINGCLFAVTGSFYAQNYSTRPVSGRLTVIGSVAQAGKGSVATISPWDNSVTHGFQKSFYYDPRLAYMSPPFYPSVKKPHLAGWWE